ncbi:MAG: diaminopimelate epimerase [Ardenticatenaceae bacterium]|nr:diaminopimelate epimerase [Ardenticatenaceae bacterium]MCB9443357.1 diaminopimelate epimerase [Ardenticatenaceae bacterium]
MNGRFHKYQALGNDMIIIDPASFPVPLTPVVIRLLCDRHFGIGGDGICYGPLPDQRPALAMRFYNPDGSEAEKSGNGLRIFARYVWDTGYAKGDTFAIYINNEAVPVNLLDKQANRLKLGMGKLTFNWVDDPLPVDGELLRATAVSIGNPHCVIFHNDLSNIHRLGPQIETAPIFPQRTNVQLVQVIDEHTIRITIWERGAGFTLASGTSASAAAGTAVRMGYCTSPVEVQMDGGTAQVEIDDNWNVMLVGEVTAVYEGTLSADMIKELEK